jgi:predicted alpha/beta-hydrolase family hydrolase
VAEAVAARGVDVITFDFLYTHAGRRRPDPPATLGEVWREVIAVAHRHLAPRALFIGGKSMGGRIATHVAAEDQGTLGLAGVVCLGYPLRPPSRLARPVSHFAALRVPLLVVQGTRDPFGHPDDVRDAATHSGASLDVWPIEGADHGFGLPRGTHPPVPISTVLAEGVVDWMFGVTRRDPRSA